MKKAILQAYAVGDSMGMPTEFMTRSAIRSCFGGLVEHLIDPREGQMHKNLPYAVVTDDTEQVCYLLRCYQEAGRVDMYQTAHELVRWVRETGADIKGYIGPSSKLALEAIGQGVSPMKAGERGTTCGGIMRSPAVVLYRNQFDLQSLHQDIYQCLVPTHNTSTALEAAGAYCAALQAAIAGKSMSEILDIAISSADHMKARAPYETVAPSCVARIKYVMRLAEDLNTFELLDSVYSLLGSGLSSADVCGAVFAIFCHAKEDVWLAIRMGASIGGDTDTIAALSGALCAGYAGGHNIPEDILKVVLSSNRTLLGELC